jgi:squalene cyclase
VVTTPSIDEVASALSEVCDTLFRTPWLHADGGFGRDPQAASDEWSTSEALILASRLDCARPDVATKARVFLLSRQHDDGGWGSNSKNSDTTGTALALLALLEMSEREDVRAAACKGMLWLSKYQNADGGWPLTPAEGKEKLSTMFPTVHSYEAIAAWLLRGVGPSAEINETVCLAANFILHAKTPDGGWGLTTKSSATVRHRHTQC